MWICNRCQHENKEALTDCQYCGASRSAGRFSSGQTGRFPRSAAPQQSSSPNHLHAAAIRMPSNDIPDPLPELEQPAAPMSFPPPPYRPVMGFAKLIGVLLCILLPALAGILAWRQYDAVSQAMIPLFLNDAAPEWARIAVYSGLCLIAGLLSLLPGLWTLMKIPPKPLGISQKEE